MQVLRSMLSGLALTLAALTLAAVTLRIYLPLMLGVFHWSFHSAYIAVAWLCWVPNLLIAEWLIRREDGVRTALRVA